MSSLPSVMTHDFSRVPQAEIPRSSFDRSHGTKTTMDSGYLVPIFVDEALPGDTFDCSMSAFARLATPIFPFMDNAYMDTFFFAVPMRLVWNNWERFNGAQDNPDDSTDYIIPTMAAPASTGYAIGSISDYFALPTGVPDYEHSALWHRAYNLIWNEWFRDQNLQDSVPVPKGDGPDDPADYVLLRRGKRHDYFTSALPWPQKGPAVPLPLAGDAPVRGLGIDTSNLTAGFSNVDSPIRGTGNTSETYFSSWTTNTALLKVQATGETGATSSPNIYADLSEVTAATINQLRQAFQIQKLYERDARGGTRYTELIRSHFGVTSPDARLQRPEYLGGGSSPLNINPIAQQSETTEASPQGNLAAIGTISFTGHEFTKSFTEHCLIIGLVNVRADLNYQQGMNRMWSRSTRWDFYWPALAHIGEQAVLNKEIYLDGSANDELTFGYQERFAEYRYKPSTITGHFRSASPESLDVWHLAQDFSALPALNASFIEDNPPFARVIATPEEPQFLLDTYFKLKCARPMPVYSVPGLIDHF